MFNWILTTIAVFIVMSAVYWIIQKIAEWYDEHHTYKWEKQADKEIKLHADEAVNALRKKFPKGTWDKSKGV